MAGTHNFLPFDSTNANMTTDASYSTDTARVNGASNGIADPLSFNKAVHQSTIMVAALAQFAANQGQTFDDTNLTNLITALTNCLATLTSISFADRVTHGLFGAADIGAINYCAAQGVPSAATYTASGTGNLLGGYHYREVLITGYNNPNGTHYVRGFSPATQRSGYDVSPSSQQVSITNLPIGASGCIGRVIYRSAANGIAGSEQYCGIIWDNTTTTYTDNLIDSQLGTGMPTVIGTSIPASVPISNTTGTTYPIPTALQVGALPHNPSITADPDNTTDGWHYYTGHTEIPGNTVGDGEICQITHDSQYIIQFAIGFHATGMIAWRVKDTGTWFPWKSVHNEIILEHKTDTVPTGTPPGTIVWWKDVT